MEIGKQSASVTEIAALDDRWATEALHVLFLKTLGEMSSSDVAALVARSSGALESEVAGAFAATSWRQNVNFARFMLVVYARYGDMTAVVAAVEEAQIRATAVGEGDMTSTGFRASEFGLGLSTLLTVDTDNGLERRSSMTCDEEGDVMLVLDDDLLQSSVGEHLGAFVRALIGPLFGP